MRTISIQRAVLHFVDHLEATEAALSANPDTVALAGAHQEALHQSEDMFRKERVARREVVRSQAVLTMSDTALDIDTTRFGGVAFVEAGQDRQSPAFRRFFPEAPSSFVRWNLRKQCEHTLNVIVPAIAKAASPTLEPFGTLLRTRAEAVLSAYDRRAKARAELATVSLEIEEWKEGVNRLRTNTYAELLKIASSKGYPKSWAEGFFFSDTTTTPEEPAEPATPPSPPTPPLPPT